jgi:hypothetical protein
LLYRYSSVAVSFVPPESLIDLRFGIILQRIRTKGNRFTYDFRPTPGGILVCARITS